jgi:hypothetical protein
MKNGCLLHDKNRARGKTHEILASPSHDSLLKCRMPYEADYPKIETFLPDKLYDGPELVSDNFLPSQNQNSA